MNVFKNVKTLFIIGFFVLIAVNCSPDSATQQTGSEYPAHDNLRVTLLPEPPQVERPLTLTLNLPVGVRPELSRVAGMNMNMGHMPVYWQHVDQGVWQAVIILGACTEPVMRWRVTIPLAGELGELPPVYTFEFVTDATVHEPSIP